jgi:X-Pro dipeptidyl-peptidase
MIGTSYNGTLALAAATTGVEGLEVVIPVAPNTSYYHYYRANGLVRSPGGYPGEDVDVLYDFVASGDTANRANCDRIWKEGVFASMDRRTGDFSEFWRTRDLLSGAEERMMLQAWQLRQLVPEETSAAVPTPAPVDPSCILTG